MQIIIEIEIEKMEIDNGKEKNGRARKKEYIYIYALPFKLKSPHNTLLRDFHSRLCRNTVEQTIFNYVIEYSILLI